MISNPTCIRPSPLLICSAIAKELRPNSLFVRWVRGGFSTRTDFSCTLRHRHEKFNFPKKIITTTQKRIWPVKNKQSEVEGVAADAGEDEEEMKSGELVEGCLSEEEKKMICEFVEGLSEKEKKIIFEILMGLSEEEKRKVSEIAEEWRREECGKIGEFVEGLSQEEKSKIRDVLEAFSEEDKIKINELVKRLDEEYKKNMSELVECLSEEGLKRVIKYLLELSEGGEGKNSVELPMVMEDLSKEDRKIIEKFACMLNEDMKEVSEFMFGIYEIVKSEGEVKMKQTREFWEGFGDGGKKKIVKFMEAPVEALSEEGNKKESVEVKIKKLLKSRDLSDEDMKYVLKLVDEMSEDSRTKAREFLEGLEEKASKILKLVDLANGFKEIDYKKLINKACLRLESIKEVFNHLGVHLLLGIVAYASMKMCLPGTEGFEPNRFNLFSLPLTSGLLLPTCQAYKDMFSNPKELFSTQNNDDTKDSILHGTFHAAFGIYLADLHIAKSNGMVMLAALVPTLAMFVLVSFSAFSEVVAKDGDLSCFGPSKYSVSMAIAILVSFLQIFKGGPIITAIDAGLGALVFTMFALYDAGKILKRSDQDDCTAAAGHLFWDLCGLFISSIKLLAMLSGLFISSA